jgi:hypothetical protein
MTELRYPFNISQGDPSDLLNSPGYKGIVKGNVTVSGISGNTVVTFSPMLPMAALIEYRVNLTDIFKSDGVTSIDGFVTFSFTTGSGSIEEVSSEISTSVLSTTIQGSTALENSSPLSIVSTTPSDHAIQQDPELSEITVEFNKKINANSVVPELISIESIPITDHPQANITALGRLTKSIEVDNTKIIIKI